MSDLGRVQSMDRIVPDTRHGPGSNRKLKGRILRPIGLSRYSPYLMVTLCKGGVATTIAVHRVVASAWIGPCPDGQEVCHGTNGKLDNSVSNLRYDTRSKNELDKRRDGTHCGRPVRRSDGKEFISLHVAAEETGCYASGIWRACNNKRKTAGGYGWEYAKNSI